MTIHSNTKKHKSDAYERRLCPASGDAELRALIPAHFLRANLGSYKNQEEVQTNATSRAHNLCSFLRQDYQFNKQIWLQWRQLCLTYSRDVTPNNFPNQYQTSPYKPNIGDLVHVLDYQTKPGL